jgi:hypothetical protein
VAKVKHGDVVHALAKSIRSKKDFDSIIQVLQEGGIINVEKVIPPTGGTPCVFYSMVRYLPIVGDPANRRAFPLDPFCSTSRISLVRCI